MGKAENCGLRTEPHRRIRENFQEKERTVFLFSHFCTEPPSGMHIPCPEPFSGIKKQAPPGFGRRFRRIGRLQIIRRRKFCFPGWGEPVGKYGAAVGNCFCVPVRSVCGRVLRKSGKTEIFGDDAGFFYTGGTFFRATGRVPAEMGEKRQGKPGERQGGRRRGVISRRKGDPGRWVGAGGRGESPEKETFPVHGLFPEAAGQMPISLNMRIHSRAMYS